MFDFDPELPGGFQEADLEMAELEEAARYHSAERKAGRCTHQWVQGLASDGTWKGDGPTPAKGEVLCLHCNQIVPDPWG